MESDAALLQCHLLLCVPHTLDSLNALRPSVVLRRCPLGRLRSLLSLVFLPVSLLLFLLFLSTPQEGVSTHSVDGKTRRKHRERRLVLHGLSNHRRHESFDALSLHRTSNSTHPTTLSRLRKKCELSSLSRYRPINTTLSCGKKECGLTSGCGHRFHSRRTSAASVSMFGQPAATPAFGGGFGASTPAPSTSLFGAPAAAAPATSLFGAPAPAAVPASGGLFGSAPPQPSASPNPFGFPQTGVTQQQQPPPPVLSKESHEMEKIRRAYREEQTNDEYTRRFLHLACGMRSSAGDAKPQGVDETRWRQAADSIDSLCRDLKQEVGMNSSLSLSFGRPASPI